MSNLETIADEWLSWISNRNKGISKIHIEGDSQIIIGAVISKKVVNWKLDYILSEVWRLLPRFETFKIGHCYREANQMADWIANFCFTLQGETHFLTGEWLSKHILKDKNINSNTNAHIIREIQMANPQWCSAFSQLVIKPVQEEYFNSASRQNTCIFCGMSSPMWE